jgi:hypothetical protein
MIGFWVPSVALNALGTINMLALPTQMSSVIILLLPLPASPPTTLLVDRMSPPFPPSSTVRLPESYVLHNTELCCCRCYTLDSSSD